ncbi:MAG TPA: vanadium-dependent haloperoxidase [Saprospiraceae bacterium]|nr:vanadium-dependent haloperoxidase [Saprospiraceae bacterium]HNT20574.1 vanadium-dependent haloperoxidase [Saprospiraceae bacterium]
MYFKPFRFLIVLIVLTISVSSCRNDQLDDITNSGKIAEVREFDSEVPLAWYNIFLEVDRFSQGYAAPAAARLLAYVGLAAYEAAVPGMPEYQSLGVKFPGLTLPKTEAESEYHWPAVLNSTYHQTFKKFYPHISQAYIDKMEALDKRIVSGFSLKIPGDVLFRSAQRGRDIADAIYAWSLTDETGHWGFKNPQPADYNPPKGPGKWKPTPPEFNRALFPFWSAVRPFTLGNEEIIGRPVQYWVGEFSEDPNSDFYKQAEEVYRMNFPVKDSLQWIGEYWSDDIFELTFETAARWISISNQCVKAQECNLETSVLLYAKMGMALCDAAIVVWKTKYAYNVESPVSYINRIIDPSWKPSLDNAITGMSGITPALPAYPSEHAGFAGAATSILSGTFGSEFAMSDKSHELRTEFNGKPRTYKSFEEMAQENALSRLYLGVNYRMDTEEGLDLGNRVAARVETLPWKK